MNMFIKYAYIVLYVGVFQAIATDEPSMETDAEILTNLTISPFLDDNRYIRLNISWGKSYDEVDLMSIRFLDSDNCNPIDGERFHVKQMKYLIIPPMSLVYPADNLVNGCEYEIIMESSDLMPNLKESINYTIPDCVQDKCKCGKPKNSPYIISSINLLHDDIYFIRWKKKLETNLSLSVLDITYIRENNTSLTKVKEKNITEYGAEILLPDLKEDVVYRINVRFSYDGCNYISSINMSVPSHKNNMSIILGLVIVVLSVALTLYIASLWSPRLRNKLKMYNALVCLNYESSEDEDVYSATPLSLGLAKEQVNTQYTPLEFLLNTHKYDEYEIPSNKIIIKEEIDKGAFGVVYYGEVFGLGNTEGYSKVAIKQLRVGVTEEEREDLLNEIKILKKVGVHKNIVRLLGCVTIVEPYMMILELVPCGSLKRYLMKLREKWSIKRRSQFFFADDMDIPNLKRHDTENLNYTKVVFDTTDDSYIQPDNSSLEDNSSRTGYIPNHWSPGRIKRISEKSQGPQSPISFASSGLPSCADTEITNLSSEPPSPIASEYSNNLEAVLDNTELQHFALQIAQGMEYLEKISITHRDLAARNILMANDKVLKISDFGLSRVGTYVSSIGKKLPLRWMAIEAIEEKICDSKTDVWSFGVVLWEIGTLGAFPYQKTPNDMVLHDLKIGKRLERPKICTDDLHTLMMRCWKEKPQDRPTFHEIVEELDVTVKRVYVDFCNLSPTYIFPSAKEETECT